MEALANRSAVSVRNFARRFRGSFGVTPAEFFTRVRVEAACRQLHLSNTKRNLCVLCVFVVKFSAR